VVMDAVSQGRYRRVSAEIWFNLRRGGQRFGKALKAVALLGADLPAVTNLQDLTAYLSLYPRRAGRVLTFTCDFRTQPALEEHDMPKTPPASELEAELEELRAYKARQEASQQQTQRRRQEALFRAERQDALAFCEDRVCTGKLAPALRDRVA